jgi:hypothetical protein
MLKSICISVIAMAASCCVFSFTANAQTRVIRKKPNICSVSTTAIEQEDIERSISQAKCYLRHVQVGGDPDLQPLAGLPSNLVTIVGRKFTIEKSLVRKYLVKNHVDEKTLGGNLDRPLATNTSGIKAFYFIIHDTSDLLSGSSFPQNINDANFRLNKRIVRFDKDGNPIAHVFINRVGQSETQVDFNTPFVTTKFQRETKALRNSRRGLFLGVELIQPRLKDRDGHDSISPEPGLTDSQLKRLALVYVAASARGGKWLIPVFHATVDFGLADGHDDPQRFDLDKWNGILGDLLKEIKETN